MYLCLCNTQAIVLLTSFASCYCQTEVSQYRRDQIYMYIYSIYIVVQTLSVILIYIFYAHKSVSNLSFSESNVAREKNESRREAVGAEKWKRAAYNCSLLSGLIFFVVFVSHGSLWNTLLHQVTCTLGSLLLLLLLLLSIALPFSLFSLLLLLYTL